MSKSVSPRVWIRPDGNIGIRYDDVIPVGPVTELVPVSRVEALEAELAEAKAGREANLAMAQEAVRQRDAAKAAPSLPEVDTENPAEWRRAAYLIAQRAWRLRSGDRAIETILLDEADRIEAERAEKAAHDTLIEQVADVIATGCFVQRAHADTARDLLAAFNITPKHGEA